MENHIHKDKWPIKENKKVAFIDPRDDRIGHGKVRHFNPAFETTCMISKGHPHFTIVFGKDHAQIVSDKNVFPDTKQGNIDCLKRRSELLKFYAKRKRNNAKQFYEEADRLDEEAEMIINCL